MHRSLAQTAIRKVQNSSLPDLLCSQSAVPFMQPPLDEESGGVFVGCRKEKENPPGFSTGQAYPLFPESSGGGSRRQKQPDLRQQRRKRLPDPHGQRSLRPSFSDSSLLPWTMRTPRFTCISDGNPFRRLLILSKKMAGLRGLSDP
jgi:hypothetical protein